MKQNDNRIFRKEDLDWKTLETIGIHKEELEKSGDMELLLQGEETETVPLKIRTPALRLTMDATLRMPRRRKPGGLPRRCRWIVKYIRCIISPL